MAEKRKTGLFCCEGAAKRSREWWEDRGWKVRTSKVKGGYVNYLSKK